MIEVKLIVEGIPVKEIRDAVKGDQGATITEKRGFGGVGELLVIVGLYIAAKLGEKVVDKAAERAVDSALATVRRVVKRVRTEKTPHPFTHVSIEYEGRELDKFSIEGMTDDEVVARVATALQTKKNEQPREGAKGSKE